MGEESDADVIRQDIEATRERMSEHADALAYKVDVPARTKDKVTGLKDSVISAVTGGTETVKSAVGGGAETVKSAVGGGTDSVMSAVSDRTPSMGDVAGQAKRAKGMAQENPLGMALGAVAIGFLAGLAVPATRLENERIGPLADELKERARDLGQEALDRGKQVATEAAQAAKETAQDSARDQAQGLREHAMKEAQDVRSSSAAGTSSSLT